MDSGKSRGVLLPIIITVVALIGLCGMAGLFASGRLARTIPASEGMPQAQPGQVIVQQPAPTPEPVIVPTREVAPPVAEIITPTVQPINPPPLTGNEGTNANGVEPQPVNPGDASANQNNNQPQSNESLPPASGIDESVQPFPAGSRPATSGSTSSGSTSSGSAGLRCGRRIVHVVQPGQNIFRISLRYDTTINAIVWRNGIDDVTKVRPGTRLVVVTCEQR